MKRLPKKKKDPTKIAARHNAEVEMIDKNIHAVLPIFCGWYRTENNKNGLSQNLGRLANIGHRTGWYWAEVARYYMKRYFKEEWEHLKRAEK